MKPTGGLRVVVAADLYWPPTIMGGPITARRWSDRLAARGHQVTVLAPSAPGLREAEAAAPPAGSVAGSVTKIVRFPAWPLPHWRPDVAEQLRILPLGARRVLGRTFDDARPDVVHLHFVTPFGMAALAEARRRGIPTLGTNHALPEQALEVYGRWIRTATPPLFAALERALWWHIVRFYNRCDAMTAPTAAAIAIYRRRGITVPTTLVSNGTDIARFAAAPEPGERRAFCARHRIPEDRRIVLYAGRSNPEKRIDVLLDAIARLPASANAHLVMTGGPVSLSAAEVARRGLEARVTLTGVLDLDEELPAAYRSAELLAHASEVEAQGIALLEGMAAGLPVVAAAAGAVNETVTHGETGLLVPVGDAGAMAGALGRLLEDEPLRRRLGGEARRRAALHDLGRSVDQIEALLTEVAGRRPTRGAG